MKSEYRSSIRSKMLIRNALLSLMAEKPFDKITITDIVNRADINRGTFYAHYKNTTEVLEKIQSDAVGEVRRIFESMDYRKFFTESEAVLTEISDFLRKDFEYYRMLITIDGGKGFLASLKDSLVGFFSGMSFLSSRSADGGNECYAAINFAINGLADTYLDILMGKSRITLEEAPVYLSKLLRRLMSPYISTTV